MAGAADRANAWAAVVVNRDAAVFLDGCLRALYDGACPPTEVVVVDTGSTDDSVSELAGWPQVMVEVIGRDLGTAVAANRGLAVTEAPVVAVLAPEVVVEAGFGEALTALFEAQPNLGAAAGKIIAPDGQTLVSAGGAVDEPTMMARHRGRGQPVEGRWDTPGEVAYAPASLMVLRRRAVEEVGGFDEAFQPGAYADVDLCYRLREAGWRVRYDPSLRASGLPPDTPTTSGQVEDWHRGRLRFAVKHLHGEAWWGRFVPAEIERLRGALRGTVEPDWPAVTGAGAIEALARAGARPLGRPRGLLDGEPLAAYARALEALRAASTALEGSVPRSWRRSADRERARAQQAFNEAVVAVLEAQDRLNREVIADVLLALLGLAARPVVDEDAGAS